MSDSAYSLRASVLNSLTRMQRPDVPWRVVLRNGAAVVLPMGVGLATGHTAIGLGIAVGALDTMFSDQPGPYRQRVWRLALASLAAALAALVGFLLGGQLLPMLLATATVGFVGGMLVVFGADIARVGMTSMILLVVTAASPIPSLAGAAGAAALIFAGGLLMMLCSVAAWPLQRYRPERQALASVYTGLAKLASSDEANENDSPALTDAMTALQRTLLGRHHARGRAMEAFRVLLELAERIRLELTAMGELRRVDDRRRAFQQDAARVLTHIAAALERGDRPEHAEQALQTLQSRECAMHENQQRDLVPKTRRKPSADGIAAHIHALGGQLAAAVRNANWAGSRGEQRAALADTELPAALRQNSVLALLRANLTPDSVAFRHAVRSAGCLSVALLLSRWLHLPHGYWLPMTAAIVLRPDFGATFNFGLLRVVGTVLGLVLTTALLYLTPDNPWAHLALMGVLCMAFRYLASAHYGVAVAALTGTVVILLSFEGVASGTAVMDRVVNTALGSGMALLAYVLWPTWERGRARGALAGMLDAYADYLSALAQPRERAAHRETRTAARTARTNALASLERMRSEPATPRALLELANALYANGNRLARTAMTLEALLDEYDVLPEPVEIGEFIEQVAIALRRIGAALREHREPGALPDLRLLQRTLARLLALADDRDAAAPLARIGERLVDNVIALACISGRKRASFGDIGANHVHS